MVDDRRGCRGEEQIKSFTIDVCLYNGFCPSRINDSYNTINGERERENEGGFFNGSRLKRKFISSGNGLRTCNHLFFHDHSWNEAGKYKPLPPFEITMMEHKKKRTLYSSNSSITDSKAANERESGRKLGLMISVAKLET